MNKGELMDKLYTGIDFIFRLVYLNVLWLAFTLLGLGLFGFGPSTMALFDTTRQWLISGIGNDKKLFEFYFQSFKKYFKTGNIIGWAILIYAYMLLVNYRFTNFRMEKLFQIINGGTIVVAFVSVVIIAYLIPLIVHYDLVWIDYLKRSIQLAIVQPLPTALIVFWIGMVTYLANQLFPFSMLLYFSALVYGVMGLCYSSFVRNEQILKENENKEEKQ